MQLDSLYRRFEQSKGVNTDTRLLRAGEMFFALTGPRYDANRFVAEALEKGASTVVCSKAAGELPQSDRLWPVDDPLNTLQQLARYHRKRLSCDVLAITGSNGKTTTRRLAAAMLSKSYEVFSTPANWNNYIGLPLSLLRMHNRHEVAILELGANQPGENRTLAQWAMPKAGLITNIGKDHLEGFGSEEGVLTANLELFDELARHAGFAWVDHHQPDLLQAARERGLPVRLYAAENPSPSVRLQVELIESAPELVVELTEADTHYSVEVSTHILGAFQLQNIAAAAAIAYSYDVPVDKIARALAEFRPDDRRMQPIDLPQGGKLILDAYNANPSSMEAGIQSFSEMKSDQGKWVILGDMSELGGYAAEEHYRIITQLEALSPGFEKILLIGPRFENALESFLSQELLSMHRGSPAPVRLFEQPQKAVSFPDAHHLRVYLSSSPEWQEKWLYVKASRALELENAFPREVLP
jgi:UDP-N-acetylmuramoyl-tripeptide--D-alanyl-D-alanine ligase